MDERRTERRRWAITTASVVAPLAVVLVALPQGTGWLLPALVVGVSASLALVGLGERYAVPANDERR